MIDEIATRERSSGAPPFSRLFYAAKAARAEREAGCQQLEARISPIFSRGTGTTKPRANAHPTVKPMGLLRWIVRLVVPPGGVVLDPFAGSGSTGIAAVLEGRPFVGIEREHEIRHAVRTTIDKRALVARTESECHARRLCELTTQQQKLVQLYYRNAVSEDVLRAEQARIKEEQSQVAQLGARRPAPGQRRHGRARRSTATGGRTTNGRTTQRRESQRRLLNLAMFEHFTIRR